MHLKAKNPHTEFKVFQEYLTAENAPVPFFTVYDVVVDCMDNFSARFLLNDTCLMPKKFPLCMPAFTNIRDRS